MAFPWLAGPLRLRPQVEQGAGAERPLDTEQPFAGRLRSAGTDPNLTVTAYGRTSAAGAETDVRMRRQGTAGGPLAWEEALDQTQFFDPTAAAPEPVFEVAPDRRLVAPRLLALCRRSSVTLEAVSLVSRLLSVAVEQARRALSASAGYLSAPLVVFALDLRIGSEKP